MPEIIDVITPNGNKCQFFTVNTAADYVILQEVALPDYTLSNPIGRKKFRAGDSFFILSSGFIIPESFTLWKDSNFIGIQPLLINKMLLKGLSSVYYKINVLGTDSDYYLPMENFEMSLDIFVDVPTCDSLSIVPAKKCLEDYNLLTYKSDALISMKNIPAAFNGKSFVVSPFFKILHNFPMF